ncbi:hypothetical protein [Nostoc sp.]
MASGALPDNPFVAAGMIEDPRLFVGRKDELQRDRISDEGRSAYKYKYSW